MKIVYNACYGGFSLSEAAVRRYAEIKGLTLYVEQNKLGHTILGPEYWLVPEDKRPAEIDWHSASDDERRAFNEAYKATRLYDRDIPRTDPALVQVVEELGGAANGHFAQLRVAEVPAGERYRIDEYDGLESVMTVDDYDWQIATETFLNEQEACGKAFEAGFSDPDHKVVYGHENLQRAYEEGVWVADRLHTLLASPFPDE